MTKKLSAAFLIVLASGVRFEGAVGGCARNCDEGKQKK